ncbi:MAG TPA: RHS repeat-associated core domain-containing protein, partial [Rubrobacter sp.]|nr:RHS repeat-associated core domain-containing protein [Rubrobacter sp.]
SLVCSDLIVDASALPRVVGKVTGATETLLAHGPTGFAAQRAVVAGAAQGVEYPLTDHQGTVRGLVSSTGAVTARTSYDAYGAVRTQTGPSASNLGYTGEYTGADGVVNLRARSYLPELGRFPQRDAFEGDATRPQSLARYPYVEGNPVNRVDPSGYTPMRPEDFHKSISKKGPDGNVLFSKEHDRDLGRYRPYDIQPKGGNSGGYLAPRFDPNSADKALRQMPSSLSAEDQRLAREVIQRAREGMKQMQRRNVSSPEDGWGQNVRSGASLGVSCNKPCGMQATILKNLLQGYHLPTLNVPDGFANKMGAYLGQLQVRGFRGLPMQDHNWVYIAFKTRQGPVMLNIDPWAGVIYWSTPQQIADRLPGARIAWNTIGDSIRRGNEDNPTKALESLFWWCRPTD